jgi:hypothetical protein
VSAQNDCRYCQTIHGAIAAHQLNGDEALVLDVKRDFEQAPISDKLKALLVIAAQRRGWQAGDFRRRRAGAPAGRHGSRDSRHGTHRRRLLHVHAPNAQWGIVRMVRRNPQSTGEPFQLAV